MIPCAVFAGYPDMHIIDVYKRQDEALTLVPPKVLSLEQAIDFIDTDELLEVTPESLSLIHI